MVSTVKSRVEAVLVNFYGNDPLRMAVDLGLDRSTVYRYTQGAANPSRTVLILLSLRASVSLLWLQNGPTDEIQYEEQSSSTAISDLGLPVLRAPVASVPAPGSPGHLGMLVAPPPIYYAGNRYWVRISEDRNELGMKRGDLILIDPCPRRHPTEDDADRVFAMKKAGKDVVDILSQADVRKAKGNVEICGTALILHRNLQE